VIAVNFHPFYRNEEEICRKQEYSSNFCTIRVVDDLYTKNSHNVIQVTSELWFGSKPEIKIVIASYLWLWFVILGRALKEAYVYH